MKEGVIEGTLSRTKPHLLIRNPDFCQLLPAGWEVCVIEYPCLQFWI